MNVIEKEFDEKADVYESYRLADWYKAHAGILLDILPKDFSGRIVDIGCGTGYLLREYLGRNPEASGVGIDISSGMVEVAKRETKKKEIFSAEFVQADWETLDPGILGTRHFDLLVCANAYHYFSDPYAAARKMIAILKEGGTAYIVERNKSGSFLTAIWDLLHRHLIKDCVTFYNWKKIEKTLEKAGFTNPQSLFHIKKYFWHGKLFTNIVILSCKKAPL